jgi:hypothetical protein
MPVVDAVATVEEEINAVENKMPVVDATEYLIQVCSMAEVVETCAEVNAEAAIRKWLPDMPATTSEMKPAMCSLVCTQTLQCAMYSTSIFSGHAQLSSPPSPLLQDSLKNFVCGTMCSSECKNSRLLKDPLASVRAYMKGKASKDFDGAQTYVDGAQKILVVSSGVGGGGGVNTKLLKKTL